MSFLGPIIGAASSLVGGLLNRDAQKDANAQALAERQADREMQFRFARHGIAMRVKDAKESGVHPLFALGAPTMNWQGTAGSVVPETGLGDAISHAGQNLSRAMYSTRQFDERLQSLSLERAELNNELLRSRIALLRGQTGPSFPGATPKIGGVPFPQDPNTSPSRVFEDRYGEMSDWIHAPRIWLQDQEYGQKQGGSFHNQLSRKFGNAPSWLSGAATRFSRWADGWHPSSNW